MKHVMIDLYGCNPQLLADATLLQHVLEEYPNLVGMQKVSPVFLKEIQTSCPLDDGLSGFVIIATSHVSLHAWPHYGMVNLDLFSCEDFQTARVADFAMHLFQTPHIEIHEVERALQSPRGKVRMPLITQTDECHFPPDPQDLARDTTIIHRPFLQRSSVLDHNGPS